MTQTTKASPEVAYLCRALKAPSLAPSFERLAERARSQEWTHQEFLAACLEREVSAHQTNGGELRIKAARLPTRKTIKDFDFTLQRSLKQNTVLPLVVCRGFGLVGEGGSASVDLGDDVVGGLGP